MATVPSDTRFVGFAPQTNLQERKSANINALSQPYTMADIANSASPVFTYNATGGSVSRMQVGYLILTDEYNNGGTGDISIQSHYVPSVNIYGDLSATSLTFYTDYIQEFTINYIGDTSYIDNLTTLNFPNLLKQLGPTGIISGLTQLTTISAPLINTGVIYIEQCHNLTTVDVSSMVNNQARLTLRNCDLINLAGITHNDQFSGFDFTDCPNLESIISIPATDIYTNFSGCISVTSISYPNAVNLANVNIQSCDNLTTVSLGSIGTVKRASYEIYLISNALNEASVNAVFALLVSLDGTNGTTLWGPTNILSLGGGTNAAPTGQGLIDKQTLIDRGAEVYTN